MPPRALLDLAAIDPDRVIADIESIRAANPQRHEFEQLSWICHSHIDVADSSNVVIEVAGVNDIPEEPFWARGHIPGRPLMPGVLMLESAAQLGSWAIRQFYDPVEYAERFFGFGGIDDAKFRGAVFPGMRLLLLGKCVEARPRRAVFATQGFVEGSMVFEAQITGLWM
jgi:3-hydroxyacyl-[acyl-carrier-protein] dehydratase